MRIALTSFIVLALFPAFPHLSIGQVVAPALGVASTFAVFTAAGRLDNAGATTVNGNIGTGTTPVTGFAGVPAGTIIGGAAHVGASGDAYATQAATDVAMAYSQITAISCMNNSLSGLGGTGGVPQILTPDVYCLGTGAALTLAGELILDAQNDPNALFIIKLNGALTTQDLSQVRLINGASVANVYWQVAGEVTLGDNSFFRGTLLTVGAIHLHPGATLYGRALTTAGAVDLNTNTVAIQELKQPLPVTLVSFTAAKQGQHALIQWATASEYNSKSFQVERSELGVADWKTVANITAAGNSPSTRQYTALDTHASTGFNYYRLRSTDRDSSSTYSHVQVVYFSPVASLPVTAFPNPASNRITVTGAGPGTVLSLTDMLGKTRLQQASSADGVNLMDASVLSPGTYLLRTVSAQGKQGIMRVSKE
jgi:hypothetical protein